MTDIYVSNHLYSEHGNAYLRNGMLLCTWLIICRFPIVALLVFDTHILQSISVVTSSNFILWGEFCYTLFWSPQWSIENMCSCSLKILKETFSMEKVICFPLSKTMSRKVIAPCYMHGVWQCLIVTLYPKTRLWYHHMLLVHRVQRCLKHMKIQNSRML